MLTSLEYYLNGDNNKIIFLLFFKAKDNQICALENNPKDCVEREPWVETADKEKSSQEFKTKCLSELSKH